MALQSFNEWKQFLTLISHVSSALHQDVFRHSAECKSFLGHSVSFDKCSEAKKVKESVKKKINYIYDVGGCYRCEMQALRSTPGPKRELHAGLRDLQSL